jgi:hypothetical protein
LCLALYLFAADDHYSYAYSPDGLKTVTQLCMNAPRPDVPPDLVTQYCQCWIQRMQENISWLDFTQLDNVIKTKGLVNLTPTEKQIMIITLMDGNVCYDQVVKN